MRSGTLAVLLLASPAWQAAIREKTAHAEEQARYNPATVINVMATVTDVREIPLGSSLAGVHLIVKAESEIIDIYLGPTDFLKQFEMRFAKGEEIQIVGSRTKLGSGAKVLLAREVRRGTTTMYCRRKTGEPYWE